MAKLESHVNENFACSATSAHPPLLTDQVQSTFKRLYFGSNFLSDLATGGAETSGAIQTLQEPVLSKTL